MRHGAIPKQCAKTLQSGRIYIDQITTEEHDFLIHAKQILKTSARCVGVVDCQLSAEIVESAAARSEPLQNPRSAGVAATGLRDKVQ